MAGIPTEAFGENIVHKILNKYWSAFFLYFYIFCTALCSQKRATCPFLSHIHSLHALGTYFFNLLAPELFF